MNRLSIFFTAVHEVMGVLVMQRSHTRVALTQPIQCPHSLLRKSPSNAGYISTPECTYDDRDMMHGQSMMFTRKLTAIDWGSCYW
ncbi:hypothetical protein EDC01DRAFT_243431 [Geopyxis carbonaria]|nr:hypothetical protein EDC01DRAFT_243431 [Geopyxis carbonaria]